MPDLMLVEAALLRVARDEGYDVAEVPADVLAALEDWLSNADRLLPIEEAPRADA